MLNKHLKINEADISRQYLSILALSRKKVSLKYLKFSETKKINPLPQNRNASKKRIHAI